MEEKKGPYVIVRCETAGVFAGNLESRVGTEATMIDVRRLWSWQGAATLSQLAVSGTSKPGGCKFPPAVGRIIVFGVKEILFCASEAEKSIREVPEWRV